MSCLDAALYSLALAETHKIGVVPSSLNLFSILPGFLPVSSFLQSVQ